MKASDLIAELQELISINGDVHVTLASKPWKAGESNIEKLIISQDLSGGSANGEWVGLIV